jgi:hypothetical protein
MCDRSSGATNLTLELSNNYFAGPFGSLRAAPSFGPCKCIGP